MRNGVRVAKRHFTVTDMFDLRQALHIATLDALMASRRWEPGDLIFQGGTSLHLVHGSPRYSEDLDFLVKSSLRLDAISDAILARLTDTAWVPHDTSLSVSRAKDGHNPHAFVVAIGGADVIGGVRVRVELWRADADVMSAIRVVVAPVKLSRGAVAGMQTFVPTAVLPEIYADKVFALGSRPYLKPRDVFDLHWLVSQTGIAGCQPSDMRVRLATYPNETPAAWLGKAFARRENLLSSIPAVTNDLKRWLPSSWPLDEANVKAMVDTSVAALDHGVGLIRDIAHQTDVTDQPDPERPVP